MAKRFSKIDLDRWLRTKWKRLGVRIREDERVGLDIAELVIFSEKRNAAVRDRHFELWIAIFDEFASWLISVTTVTHWSRFGPAYKPTKYEQCVVLLLMRITADSLAMRHMMTLGFDAAARILLRSAAEHMEVLIAIIDDPVLADKFEKTRNAQEANRFWKQHIAKDKLRLKVRAAWLKFFGGEHKPSKWFSNWGYQMYSDLSAITHPSFMGCAHAVLPAEKTRSDEKWLGTWGAKSLTSIGTIETYISYMFPMLLAIGEFPFDKNAPFAESREFNARYELHKHIKRGRSVLASLVLSLQLESNQKHVYPRSTKDGKLVVRKTTKTSVRTAKKRSKKP